jgi:hypothetical protein
MGRKDIKPTNDSNNKKFLEYETKKFDLGVIKDMPASELPNNAIADGFNVNCYPTEVQGRLGSRLYTDLSIPAIDGRTGYTASKTGYNIWTDPAEFTDSDIGSYFVFPGQNQQHFEIVDILSVHECKTDISGNINSTSGCYLRGKQNVFAFHKILKKWILMYGSDLYIADLEMAEFTKVLIASYLKPSDAISMYYDFNEWSGVLFNSNGIFKIDLSLEIPLCYKINIPIPQTAITAQPETPSLSYQYGYIYGAARLEGHGLRDRLTPSRISLETGTNQWDEFNRDYRDVWTRYPVGDEYDFNGVADGSMPKVVGPLWVPQACPDIDADIYERHLTHFPIYRTLDKAGLYKQGTSELSLNNPERFVWVKDLRMGAAFYARRYNGKIEASVGFFEKADIGSTIQFADGSRETIREFLTDKKVKYTNYPYYAEETGWQGAAIGNGKVMTASQTGNVVTKTTGDDFKADDVGSFILWSTGYQSIITKFNSASSVDVQDDFTKSVQGITMNPVYRYFNDTISDDKLRTRETTLLCGTRFLEPIDNCNIGIIVPGFMVCAKRGEKKIFESQLSSGYEYLAGYCNKGFQISESVKDNIQFLLFFPGRLIVLCGSRTWYTATNLAEIKVMPNTGLMFSVLPGFDILDGNIGCYDWGSIQEISSGMYQLLTSEPGSVGWRKFDGYKYGDNELEVPKLGQFNYYRDISSLIRSTSALYDGEMGLMIWGRKSE